MVVSGDKMNNLEEIVSEYYNWKDYLVKKNILVGKRASGGYEMELDIVAFQPHTNHLIHIETSLDAYSWEKRSERFSKKFKLGTKYIISEVFTWLSPDVVIDQLIILPSKPKSCELDGIKVITIDEMFGIIIKDIKELGQANKNAIPEQYSLLRAVQFAVVGYVTSPLNKIT